MASHRSIVVAGASGLLGTALVEHGRTRGDAVLRLIRSEPSGKDESRWDPANGEVDAAVLDGADAVLCLSGENIAQRWTDARKRRILNSRVQTAGLLADACNKVADPPKAFICASGVGYYGDRGDDFLTEDDAPGDDFLAGVCKQWEAAARRAEDAGVRTVMLRLGVVFSEAGGFLPRLLPIFKLGLGGRIASGEQYMAWIALHDVVRLIDFVIDNESISGPVNAVAPETVTNAQFTKAFANALHRPAIFPVPKCALSIAMGEAGRALALSSARAIPDKLTRAGFEFDYPNMDTALRTILTDNQ